MEKFTYEKLFRIIFLEYSLPIPDANLETKRYIERKYRIQQPRALRVSPRIFISFLDSFL